MKKILCLCLLFVGCAYSPSYYVVKDSYNTNTYAPTYAPATATTAVTYPPPVIVYRAPTPIPVQRRVYVVPRGSYQRGGYR